MLRNLTISNYALIDHLEFSPAPGLSIITGETGAGKSIMLGAVGLLLGNRADTRVLLDTSKKCVIEGEFEIGEYNVQSFFDENDLDYDDASIIRREISPAGKSRGFINDTPVNLEVMRTLGTYLMDVHSQNDTQRLGSPAFQLRIVDAFADTLGLYESFKAKYQHYISAKLKYEGLLEEETRIRKEADFNSFLLEELTNASFEKGEQERLEEEQEILSNSEEIKSLIHQAIDLISSEESSLSSGIESLSHLCRRLSKFSGHYSPLAERVESILIELNDISHELGIENDKVDHDPERTLQIQERLSMLYQLTQKHQTSGIEELLAIQEELESKVSRFQSLDEELNSAKDLLKEKEQTAVDTAKILSSKRQASFEKLCSNLVRMLSSLGMPDAVISIDHNESELNPYGVDSINILFSANKGISPQVLKAVASGGEFSRLMFCIKYLLAKKTSLPTIIFDEIDTGVSGEIAIQLGSMMREMATKHQVVSISHLPQMAAKADRHFFVYKDSGSQKAVSRIRMLTESERVEEIAKMIAGDNPTASAFESAKELIDAK
jgi:DNA repair protein RecN (Recombination protein N)